MGVGVAIATKTFCCAFSFFPDFKLNSFKSLRGKLITTTAGFQVCSDCRLNTDTVFHFLSKIF